MVGYRNVTTGMAIVTCLVFSYSLRAQIVYPPQMQDKSGFNSKYFVATDLLKKSQKLSSLIVDHDQQVLNEAYIDLKPQFEKKGFTSDDSATAVVNAWYTLRFSQAVAPDTGITKNRLDEFLIKAEPIVIDSAPRGADVKLIPDGGYGPIRTRNTVFVKHGTQLKLHFSLPGFADYDETITAADANSVVCRELRPLDPKTPKSSCPK